jgi:hypothetical protein
VKYGNVYWSKAALDLDSTTADILLTDVGVPPVLHSDCVHYLIDYAHSVFKRLPDGAGGRVVLVDSRGTLQLTDWANELHPKPDGFRKIASTRWRPVLEALALC